MSSNTMAKGIEKIKEATALDNEMGAMAVDDPARPAKANAAINAYMQGIEYFAHARKCKRRPPSLPRTKQPA